MRSSVERDDPLQPSSRMGEYARRSLPQNRRDEDTDRTTSQSLAIRKSNLEVTIFARARQK